MANKDVELRIRARDYSQKPLKQVSKAIDSLVSSQKKLDEAAKKGEASTRDLERNYRKLEQAGEQLLRLNSLNNLFKHQTDSLSKVSQELVNAKAKHAQLASAMASSSNVTKKMQSDYDKAEKAVQRLTQRQNEASQRVTKTAADMAKFGLSTTNTAQNQAKLALEIKRTNAALAQQEASINKLPSAAERANAKVLAALKLQAQQLLANTRGYQTLGRVMANSQPSLARDLTAIISPATQALSTLSGLESKIKQVSETTKKLRTSTDQMKTGYKELEAVLKSSVGMARSIDDYRRQMQAVRTARTEYRAAVADAKKLSAEIQAAGSATAEMGNKMQLANARLANARNGLQMLSGQARQTQAALRSAGIDTRSLTTESDRLKAGASRATQEMNRLTEAMRRSAEGARNNGKAWSFFRDEGRTTLSFLQRIRGEMLALASTYIGFQGAINLAGGAIDAFKVKQQAMVKIGTIVGQEASAQNKEWEYMIGLSDRLGIQLDTVAKSYTKFAVAAHEVGMSMQETKFIFENIAKAGRVYHLSNDELGGIFLAIEQMLSKGQVYAQELRQQLGERLPGAVARFAKAEGMTVMEFLKAMEMGQIKAQSVINFAQGLNESVESQLDQSTKSVDAVEARAHNAMMMFKMAIAESGFLEAYTNMLIKLTEFISSSKGEEAAQKIGAAFSALADGVIWAADNVDTLITIFSTLLGLKIGAWLFKIGRWFFMIGKNIKAATAFIMPFIQPLLSKLPQAIGLVGGMTGALKLLTRAIPYVGWALLAWDLVSILREYSETVDKFCSNFMYEMTRLGNAMVDWAQVPGAAIKDLILAIVRPVTTIFKDSISAVGNWFAELVSYIPGVGASLSDWVKNFTDDMTKQEREMFESTQKQIDGSVKAWNDAGEAITNNYKKQLDERKKATEEAAADATILTVSAPNKQDSSAQGFTPNPGTGSTPRDRSIQALQKEVTARLTAEQKAELAGRRAMQRKNLAGRLAIIDEEYKAMYKKAEELGGKEGADFKSQIDKIVAMAKKAETDQFNAMSQGNSGIDKRKAKLESLIATIEKMRAEINRKQIQQDPTSSLDQRISAEQAKAEARINQLRTQAAALGGKEGKEIVGKLDSLKQQTNEYLNEKMQLEEVERLQNKVNSIMEQRKAQMAEVNALRKAGMIDEETQVERIKEIAASTEEAVGTSLDDLNNQLTLSSSLFSPEELARIKAGMAEVKAEVKDLSGQFMQMDATVVQGVLQGMNVAINSMYDNLVNVAIGAESIGGAFANLGLAVAQFFADFLKQIAMAIIQQMILNSLAGIGGGIGKAATMAGGVAAPVKHAGGIVGGASNRNRSVSDGIFAGAQRYHTGGLPGIKADEIPIIAQKGEEILAKNDPRNILNGGGRQAGNNTTPQNMRMVLVDDRSRIPEAMASREGEQVMMVNINRQAQTVRQMVGRKNGRRN